MWIGNIPIVVMLFGVLETSSPFCFARRGLGKQKMCMILLYCLVKSQIVFELMIETGRHQILIIVEADNEVSIGNLGDIKKL
jgi:hypothetical protein